MHYKMHAIILPSELCFSLVKQMSILSAAYHTQKHTHTQLASLMPHIYQDNRIQLFPNR